MRVVPFVVALVLSCALGRAVAQPPAISTISPGAVRPGQAVDLSLVGGSLAGANGLWTSFAAKTELTPGVDKNGTLADRVVYRVTVPADATVGIAAVRVSTAKGTSSLKPLMIDDLPSAAASGANRSAATAQPVAAPIAIDGACERLQSDFYKISAKAGQAISFEVVAQRLGSALDPVLRLTDASGHELAFSDDEAGIGGDARFRHRFAADGEFLVELRDVKHQGGAAHFYRLRIGDFPLVNVAFPLGAPVGSAAMFTAAGTAVEGVQPTLINIPLGTKLGPRSVAFRFPGGQASGFATIDVSAQPEAVDIEPNDEPAMATKIAIPAGISGRFDRPKDRDIYEFAAKKGERFTFTGRTRTLGSPSDLLLRVTNADGGGLGEAEDNGPGEGALNVTFPNDGVYRLVVEDLLRRGGPEHAYRVEVAPYQPGFSLSLETDKLDVPQDGSVVVKVACARRDYNGPIELAVEGIAEGVALEGQIIPEGKPETQLRITLPAAVAAGQFRQVRIVGRAKIGDRQVVDEASTLVGLRKLFAGAPYPAPTLEGLLAVGVGPVYPPFFEVSVDGGRVQFPHLVGEAKFKVRLKRLDGAFKAPISVAVENLPAGVTATVKPVGAGEAEYDVTLKGPEKLPDAMAPLRIVGIGTHNSQTKRAVVDAVPLVAVQPLAMAVTPAGPIAPGGQQKLKVVATRMSGEKTPISIVWRKRPVGINAPDQMAIAPDQNEIEIALTAAADAPLGKFADLIIGATTTIKGQNVTVDSPAATLEVKK